MVYTLKNKYRNLAIFIICFFKKNHYWHLKASKIIFIFKNYIFTSVFFGKFSPVKQRLRLLQAIVFIKKF